MKISSIKLSLISFCLIGLCMINHADAQSRILPHESVAEGMGERLIFFLNSSTEKPLRLYRIKQDNHLKDYLFYWILGLLFTLGVIRSLYAKYMDNFIKVIFNSTLRQSQLVEQLNLSNRPSFYLNLIFIFSFSTYLFLIIIQNHSQAPSLNLFLLCTFFVLVSNLFKSLFIKFLGWMTGFVRAAGNYLTVFWLMNKATGLLCLCWIVLMAFSPTITLPYWQYLSLVTILLMIIIRYVKILSIVRYDIQMQGSQLVLFILCVEFIPIGLIYKCFTHFL